MWMEWNGRDLRVRIKYKDTNTYTIIGKFCFISINSPGRGEKVIKIDAEDVNRVKMFTWSLHTAGYATSALGSSNGYRSSILMHRLVMSFPESIVDHLNGNRLNNTKENLRECSRSQNKMNSKARSDSLTGLKGVTASYGKFQARIMINGKSRSLGLFSTKEEAFDRYKKASIENFKEFSFFKESCSEL